MLYLTGIELPNIFKCVDLFLSSLGVLQPYLFSFLEENAIDADV